MLYHDCLPKKGNCQLVRVWYACTVHCIHTIFWYTSNNCVSLGIKLLHLLLSGRLWFKFVLHRAKIRAFNSQNLDISMRAWDRERERIRACKYTCADHKLRQTIKKTIFNVTIRISIVAVFFLVFERIFWTELNWTDSLFVLCRCAFSFSSFCLSTRNRFFLHIFCCNSLTLLSSSSSSSFAVIHLAQAFSCFVVNYSPFMHFIDPSAMRPMQVKQSKRLSF